jgi:signal transduction histidine kinase
MASISEFGRAVSNERDPAKVLRRLITDAIRLLQVQGASVLIIPSSGELREAVVHGFKRDPLLTAEHPADGSLAGHILNDRVPRLITDGLNGSGNEAWLEALEGTGFASALAVPLLTQEREVGLLTTYGDAERTALDEDDLQLAVVLGSTAAMGYANSIAWRQMEDFSRGLEAQVDERTNELRRTLAESRQLAADLADKKALLEDAYRGLEALDQVKNELIRRLSLEFRTPVTSLYTAAKVLDRERDAPDDKRERLVTVIFDEAEKLLEMIQSVFQAQVLTVDAASIERRPVPVQDLFRKALAPLRDLAKSGEVKLQVLIPSGFESIDCEPESLQAALRAMVKNGIEFNRPGGEVKLEVRRVVRGREPWLQLRVSDTGIGIAEADVPLVFDAFWQGDDSAVGKRYGIGLGLAIAKRVAENHGGSISIDSAVGRGTEVVLAIPQQS